MTSILSKCYDVRMELSKETSKVSYQIQGYRNGAVIINHVEKPCPIIIMPEYTFHWELNSKSLTTTDLDIFIKLQPDLIIIGTGEIHQLLPPETLIPLINAQIGFEVMNSAAACRTYSIMALEGRNVAVGIIA